MLSILLLGAPQISRDYSPVDVPRRKSRALLYYLAARGTPMTREHVLSFFWPDHERSAAQQVLRTTLHGLRKALGDGLVIGYDTLGLASTAQVDVQRFEALLTPIAPSETTLAEALALYRGDFLADVTLPDTPTFETWMEAERARLRRLAVQAMLQLAQQYEAQQRSTEALNTIDRALELEPLQEELHRAAMRVLYRSGDRASAIRRFERVSELLDDELGVPPMAETRELYDAIVTDTPLAPLEPPRGQQTPAAPANRTITEPAEPPFTGRSSEFAALRRAAESYKVAVIEGEAGIGKTRLAEEWIEQSRTLPLIGSAQELERSLPYQPMIEALRKLLERDDWTRLRAEIALPPIWRAEAARLLPELDGQSQARLPEPADESRLWEGVRQFLLALARLQPLTLFLDDLHWADSSTLALLGYLVRQPSEPPITILAATRPVSARTPLGALLQTLTRADRLVRVQLTRLNPDDALALGQRLSAPYDAALAEWLASTSEGNPYIMAELMRFIREQASSGAALETLFQSPVVPRTIYSLIESRVVQLSDAARKVLDTAVAIGREFAFDLVARAAKIDESEVLDALDELREVGLIRPTHGLTFTFDHSLTMEVAYREVGEPRHRAIHRHVAEALEQLHQGRTDEVAGLIASHFAESNAPDRAAPYALRAGQQAADLAAWAEAISFYEQALRGDLGDQRIKTMLALGSAQTRAGALAQATETLRGATALAEANGETSSVSAARIGLAGSLLLQGRYAEVIEVVQPLLSDRASAGSAEFFWGTALSLEGADLEGATEHLLASSERMAACPADAISVARVRFELGSIAAQQGDLERAVQLYRNALEVARTVPDNRDRDETYELLALNNLAYHLHLLNDATAIEYAREGIALAQERGALGAQTYLYSTLGEILLAQGDDTAAEAMFFEGLALSERLSIPERVAGITANLGLVALKRGQNPLAIHRLSTALARADALGTRHLAAQIRLWLAPLLPPAEAHATLAEARAIAEGGGRKRLLVEIERLEGEIG